MWGRGPLTLQLITLIGTYSSITIPLCGAMECDQQFISCCSCCNVQSWLVLTRCFHISFRESKNESSKSKDVTKIMGLIQNMKYVCLRPNCSYTPGIKYLACKNPFLDQYWGWPRNINLWSLKQVKGWEFRAHITHIMEYNCWIHISWWTNYPE